MRISYYAFPRYMTARGQYRILKAEGFCNKPEPPQDLTDEEILNCMGIYHMCKLKEAKRMMAKYGGTAHTEWYDRDGSFQDSMDISLDRANKGSYRSA